MFISLILGKIMMLFLLMVSCLSFFLFLVLSVNSVSYYVEYTLFILNGSEMDMVMIFDWKSCLFMSVVSIISSMVLWYSEWYMGYNKKKKFFLYLVILFVISMLFMIISPNLISIILGWDGLGLTSYILVIYYQNNISEGSGMITILMNRVGDAAILLSIGLMLSVGSWNFMLLGEDSVNMFMGSLLVILAGMTKSAQVPFSAWLPAAMAAPTPVSALVHSSTLVTAGVYLMIRFYNVLMINSVEWVLFYVGVLTMFMAGISANFECDLKKVIALSTLSQLGVMMSAVGMGLVDVAYFHLLTHALFKALLFMCAGGVIHNMGGYQDTRLVGCLMGSLPITSMNMVVSSLSLCGMPFLSGFYSKDFIIEMMYISWSGAMSSVLFLASVMLTISYSVRLIMYLFVNFMGYKVNMDVKEEKLIVYPMNILMVGAVTGGSMMLWLIFDYSEMVCFSLELKLLMIILLLMGFMMGLLKESVNIGNNLLMGKLLSFLSCMWFMPYLSSQWMLLKYFNIGVNLKFILDNGWVEEVGSQGLYKVINKSIVKVWFIQGMGMFLLVFSVLFWVFISII